MARDAHAIALDAFAHAHEPLPHFLTLYPAAVLMALSSMLLPMALAPEALDDAAPVLALCPSVVPMAFSQFLNPDHSIRSWLTAALVLAITPFFAKAKAIQSCQSGSILTVPRSFRDCLRISARATA